VSAVTLPAPLATLSTTTDTKNTAYVSVQSSESGTAYLVHSSVVVNVNTTQAMLDALASANKVNKVTIATANTATDSLAKSKLIGAVGLEVSMVTVAVEAVEILPAISTV
jgi:hypothetical protein